MIYEMKGDLLKYVLENVDSKTFMYNNIPAKGKYLDELRYILVDFNEWLNLITSKNNDIKYKIERYNVINDFMNEEFQLLYILKYKLYNNTIEYNKVARSFMNKDIINFHLLIYNIFMSEMMVLQSKLFKQFTYNNNSVHPFCVIPFSFALNRVANYLFEINEKDDEIEITQYDIEDSVKRLKINSNINLVYTRSEYNLQDTFPNDWLCVFDNIKPSQTTYQYRIDMLKETYNQYRFYGFKQIDSVSKDKIYLLNFPFMNDTPYNKKISVNKLNTINCNNIF